MSDDRHWMHRALELAAMGRGHVEPNPMVGAVVVRDGECVGEGFHAGFGESHAEVGALRAAGEQARGATLVVTLEPCCHQGKTPPCTEAVIAAGIRRVVTAMVDPYPQVAGKGLAQLAEAGIETVTGCMAEEAARLNAPFITLQTERRPWVIAKWAQSLDGQIAPPEGTGWISCEASRSEVHALRGRLDAILVGRGTVDADDPLLTARPAGARVATRIVLDSHARLPSDSHLVRTLGEAPVLVATTEQAGASDVARLRDAGCECLALPAVQGRVDVTALLAELGRRGMTNLLVEGGEAVLNTFFDADLVDEVVCYIATETVLGKGAASSPVGGQEPSSMAKAMRLAHARRRRVGSDVCVWGLTPSAASRVGEAAGTRPKGRG